MANRLLCVREVGATERSETAKKAPSPVVGEQYTVSDFIRSENIHFMMKPLPGLFYSLWELGATNWYHESLFAALSDDYETERIVEEKEDLVTV